MAGMAKQQIDISKNNTVMLRIRLFLLDRSSRNCRQWVVDVHRADALTLATKKSVQLMKSSALPKPLLPDKSLSSAQKCTPAKKILRYAETRRQPASQSEPVRKRPMS